MSILFMTFFAMFVFLLYVNSIFKPLSELNGAEEKLQESFNELEDAGAPRGLGVGITKAIAISLVIFYDLFYIISACILNQLLYTLISAAFIVISINSLIKFFRLVDGKEHLKLHWHSKLHSLAGLIYTAYFFVQYYYMHTDNFAQLVFGALIALILFVLLKSKKPKEQKDGTL